eukprot:m.268529 g.268529  ORF g.268529 m.268529 type:complete len:230 (+) comp26811_c0_seq1:1591-2280(+)
MNPHGQRFFASPDVLVMEINGTKWKLFGSDETVQAVLPNVGLLPHELNCSVVNQGVCMKDAPIVAKIENTDDIGQCCAACLKNTACIAWNVNTFLKTCFLRGTPGPTETNSSCASGQVRPYTPPPPGPPKPVSVGYACWMGPEYPNATVNPGCNATMHCPGGCLFNLDVDPGEHFDVASVNADVVSTLTARLYQLQQTVFSPDRTGGGNARASNAAIARGHYWGPFIFP